MINLVFSFLRAFFSAASEMAPYLLFGFLMAGLFSGFLKAEWIRKHLGGKGFTEVLKASALGVPLPLCSCSVIPVSASLRKQGASRGATTAFLISTPQTGVDSILVTLGVLGPVFAIFKALAALLSGILGGGLISFFRADEGAQSLPSQEACGCEDSPKKGLSGLLRYGFFTLPKDIGKSLVIGLVAAALISALIPDYFFARFIGNNFIGMLVMAVLGIPLYVCATASVPVAAALIMKGFSPGAGLVFLMAGPATNAATLSAMWKIMGRKTVYIYLAVIGITAVGSGLLFDLLFGSYSLGKEAFRAWELPSLVNVPSLVILVLVLLKAFNPFKRKGTGGEICSEPGCSCKTGPEKPLFNLKMSKK